MSFELSIFDYIKGEEFTEKLKEVNGVGSLGELANIYNVPKTTFSTWNSHKRNSHELVVRTHLRTGIPVQELILPKSFLLLSCIIHFGAIKKHLGQALPHLI